MIKVGSVACRTCAGVTRRHFLQVGAVGALGLTLADALRFKAEGAADKERDKSCIFIWLDGGPSHFETFDPKPEAPSNIRGPYGAIETNVSGIRISELLPLLARQADKYAIIRSMTHSTDAHSPVLMLTGGNSQKATYGAVVSYLKGFTGPIPPYVHLGQKIPVGGGALGAAYDPFPVPDPTATDEAVRALSLTEGMSSHRFGRRRVLLEMMSTLQRKLDTSSAARGMDSFYQRAFSMLTSTQVKEAFNLSKEKEALRERYGFNTFGQSCLLARRLVEAGARFVEIQWYYGIAFHGWDVHGADLAGLSRMETHLCPRLDMGLSALIEDLAQRGLLESTLVVACGEFGRTPQINRWGGRDHWPPCQSVFIAGAGVPGGLVIGASDSQGAYPTDRPVRPADFAHTLYRLLGLDPNRDPRLRALVPEGDPVPELV